MQANNSKFILNDEEFPYKSTFINVDICVEKQSQSQMFKFGLNFVYLEIIAYLTLLVPGVLTNDYCLGGGL